MIISKMSAPMTAENSVMDHDLEKYFKTAVEVARKAGEVIS